MSCTEWSLGHCGRSGENRPLAPLAQGRLQSQPQVLWAAQASQPCRGLWLRRGGALCFEPRLPRAGGPSLELRPQQEEAQQRRASPSCCAASLNLSFLHCKMGTKTPKLAGTCEFSGLTREIDQVRSRSCSEDRDRACAGRADRATCPLESPGAAWARAVWSHPLLAIPPPSPGPRLPPPSQRGSE